MRAVWIPDTYDAEGNVLTANGATYVYDALNRRVASSNGTASVGYGAAAEFVYDPFGRRTSTWITSINFGNEGRIYADNRQIAYRAFNGQTFFEHQDWLGTERMRTNYQGQVAAKSTSLAFGEGYMQNVLLGDSDQDNLHFAGLDHDVETNTDHAQFRQYSPTQGRWMSPDPYDGSYHFGDPQSLNRYAYVENNPLSFTDPTGLQRPGEQADQDLAGGGGDGPDGLMYLHGGSYFGSTWNEFGTFVSVSSPDGDGQHTYSGSSWNDIAGSDSGNSVVGTGIYSTYDGGQGGAAISSTFWGLLSGNFTYLSLGRISVPNQSITHSVGPAPPPIHLTQGQIVQACAVAAILQGGMSVPGGSAAAGDPSIDPSEGSVELPGKAAFEQVKQVPGQRMQGGRFEPMFTVGPGAAAGAAAGTFGTFAQCFGAVNGR